MGLTGVIFGVIAALWLIYLVPLFLARRHDPTPDEIDPAAPFSASVTIVRRGTSLATAEEGTAVLSTPLTRRAALYELGQIERQAAARRRRVLLFLLLVEVLVSGLALVGMGTWWSPLVPAALLICFVIVARVSVTAMKRDLAARAARINAAGDEQTVAVSVVDDEADDTESVELSVPISRPASLWDPIPITAPTYVSKPLAPRTVRTIDLSAPVPPPKHTLPVTADGPVETPADESNDQKRGRAAG